jgi:hypothetical protein
VLKLQQKFLIRAVEFGFSPLTLVSTASRSNVLATTWGRTAADNWRGDESIQARRRSKPFDDDGGLSRVFFDARRGF